MKQPTGSVSDAEDGQPPLDEESAEAKKLAIVAET
jgi:hypothetical protein